MARNISGARSPAWNQYTVNDGKTGYMELLFPWQAPTTGLFNIDENGDVTAGVINSKNGSTSFQPTAYGAVGNGTADDTVPVAKAFAAAITAGGTVNLGNLTYLTTSPIVLNGAVRVTGGAGFNKGGITNASSDLFTISVGANIVTFENCSLISAAGGGHIFQASGSSVSAWTWRNCYINQGNAAKGIWYQLLGGLIDSSMENCNVYAAASASLAPFSFLACPGAVNSVRFVRSQFTMGATPAVPYFNFDPGYGRTDTNVGMTMSSTTVTDPAAVVADLGLRVYSTNFAGGSALITAVTPGVGYVVNVAATATLSAQTCIIGLNGWYEEIKFDHVVFELCAAGAISANGCYDFTINDCAAWDVTATSDVYHFYTGNTGYWCQNVSVRGGKGGAVTGGAKNFSADANCLNILLESFGQGWFTAPVISSPAAQTTIINGVNTVSPYTPTAQLPKTATTNPAIIGTPVAGTNGGGGVQLADTTRDYMVYLEVGTAGTAWIVSMGHTSAANDVTLHASGVATAGQVLSFRLPAGWYFLWSATTATLAQSVAVGC